MNQHEDGLQGDKNTADFPPAHPLFESCNKQASFIECIDAINRVRLILDLCNALDLDSDNGLTPRSAAGFFWVSVLMRESLTYASKRLTTMHRRQRRKSQDNSRYLSALINSLYILDEDNRKNYLDSVATQMGITRSKLDKSILRHRIKNIKA